MFNNDLISILEAYRILEGVEFKINSEKAKESVECDFTDQAPNRKGLNNRWRLWMRAIYTQQNLQY